MSNVDVTRDAPRAPLAPVDPNVRMPAAVAAAAARAEAFYKPDPAASATPAPAPAPAASVQPPTPSPAPAPQPAPPVTGAGNEPAPAPAPAPTPTPTPAEPVDEASWEHKFKSMQGRFNSSQNQLRMAQDQLSQMGSELSALTQRLEDVQQRVDRPAPARLVTDKDRQDFGDEFIDVASRAAQEVLTPEVAELRQQVGSLAEELRAQKMRDMYTVLDTAVPSWRSVNRSQAFLNWLSLRDGMSGAIRRVLLDTAYRAADAARVRSIFQGFLSEDAASRPAPPVPASPAPDLAPARTTVPLETFAAPGRARSSPASAAVGEKPIYTQRDISAFYKAVRTNVYAGREAEKNAIEGDIFAAQREGRVRG